jgi:hypothetical protein
MCTLTRSRDSFTCPIFRPTGSLLLLQRFDSSPNAPSRALVTLCSSRTSGWTRANLARLLPEFYLPVARHCLSLTVSLVYKGLFGGQGYRLGRCAAALYRIRAEPREDGGVGTVATGLPELIGHAAYAGIQSAYLRSQSTSSLPVFEGLYSLHCIAVQSLHRFSECCRGPSVGKDLIEANPLIKPIPGLSGL